MAETENECVSVWMGLLVGVDFKQFVLLFFRYGEISDDFKHLRQKFLSSVSRWMVKSLTQTGSIVSE